VIQNANGLYLTLKEDSSRYPFTFNVLGQSAQTPPQCWFVKSIQDTFQNTTWYLISTLPIPPTIQTVNEGGGDLAYNYISGLNVLGGAGGGNGIFNGVRIGFYGGQWQDRVYKWSTERRGDGTTNIYNQIPDDSKTQWYLVNDSGTDVNVSTSGASGGAWKILLGWGVPTQSVLISSEGTGGGTTSC